MYIYIYIYPLRSPIVVVSIFLSIIPINNRYTSMSCCSSWENEHYYGIWGYIGVI